MKEKLYNALPFVCLVSGLIITVLFFRNELLRHELNQKTYFTEQTQKIRRNLEYRLQTYLDEQIAGAAFLSVSEDVTRIEWARFVNALKLDLYYPGINGLGFAVPLQKKDSLVLERNMKAEGLSGFEITGMNQTPAANDLFVIKYIEPLARNQQALGFDMGSEPVRRAAMEKARDTKAPVVSGRVVLVQDEKQTPGFLIYVPVFKEDPDTAITRFIGWSYAPFIANDFMKGVLFQELRKQNRSYEIELYDGGNADSSKLMYKSWEENAPESDAVYEELFPVYSNTWLLRIVPNGVVENSKNQALAYVILIGGILLNLTLFFLLRSLANTRRNAMALAEKMTNELRVLNQNLDRKVEERTRELAAKNKQLSEYSENLKNAYEDMEVKVKFRNLQLEKQVKALQKEVSALKNQNG